MPKCWSTNQISQTLGAYITLVTIQLSLHLAALDRSTLQRTRFLMECIRFVCHGSAKISLALSLPLPPPLLTHFFNLCENAELLPLLPARVWADRQLCLGHLFLSCGWLQASCSSVCVEAWSCGRLTATRPSDVRFKHRQIDVNQITRRPRIKLVKSHFRATRERDGEREKERGSFYFAC